MKSKDSNSYTHGEVEDKIAIGSRSKLYTRDFDSKGINEVGQGDVTRDRVNHAA
jgi:hypothetical protein